MVTNGSSTCYHTVLLIVRNGYRNNICRVMNLCMIVNVETNQVSHCTSGTQTASVYLTPNLFEYVLAFLEVTCTVCNKKEIFSVYFENPLGGGGICQNMITIDLALQFNDNTGIL
jgi:hypothetical protein